MVYFCLLLNHIIISMQAEHSLIYVCMLQRAQIFCTRGSSGAKDGEKSERGARVKVTLIIVEIMRCFLKNYLRWVAK